MSTTTLFKHFPVKEALVFDEDADQEDGLLAAVRERPEGQSFPAAPREHALGTRLAAPDSEARFTAFTNLVNSTPALRGCRQAMWLRHTSALAKVIAEESGLAVNDPACTALAHLALEATRAVHTHEDPGQAITRAFHLLDNGWSTLARA
ncbi:TetR/AcrR family transcriptional regulator [Streptomyces sp. NPDC007905]|uniref:acyl-CoA-like ligand-binding transcription factor n=1 Tax=Streptomyces sp. NPDC007905 TaxID=3364788 RepID=UPI0036E6AD63